MPAASRPGRVRGRISAAARLILAAILLAATAAAGAADSGAAGPEAAGTGAAPRFFASDPSGFRGPAIAAPPASGYALAVETVGNEERRILLKDGLEIERRVRAKGPKGSVERLFRGASLVEESKSGPGGELLEELFYEEAAAHDGAPGTGERGERGERGDQLREKRSYVYTAGRLARVEVSDGNGQSLGGLEYRYDPRGRLLEIRATGSFGVERSGMDPSPTAGEGGGLGLEWSERGGELAIRRYDAEGRALLAELRRGGTLLRRET
ncbi:MAG: hypothetical protein JNG85_09025, partial [Spirochaetaceae bacterium]|nr:hypothetical protein [Spirochaetaceae bacterium]